MNRPVPLWLVLFLGMCGLLFSITLAFSVRSTMMGSDRTGVFGQAAVKVASFPGLAKQVLTQVRDYATGDFRDTEFVIPREVDIQASGFSKLVGSEVFGLSGLQVRATPQARHGWRLLAGSFRMGDRVDHAALLISPELELVHVWSLQDRAYGPDVTPVPPHKTFPHGVEFLPDGSLIYAFDGTDPLQRVDFCGNPHWVIGPDFHHSVTLDPGGDSVWTLRRQGIVEVAVEDGEVLREIATAQIAAANPDIDIFGPRRSEENNKSPNQRDLATVPLADPTHLNDVDPLPPELAAAFPMFAPGDLLISSRSLNGIFVINPDTLEIKWWRLGFVRRQHDPDWMPTGEILVYDNRMGLGNSRIVAIDPETYAVREVFDGAGAGFFSLIRGKQQRRPDGTLVITSPQQGYAFETGTNGDIVLEIVNAKLGNTNENYVISEMKWYPADKIDLGNWTCT